MPKLRIVYIVSLVILGVLTVFTVFRPMAQTEEFSTVQRESILETEEEWIVEFNILNHEGEDQRYIITVVIGDEQYSQKVLIEDGKSFTYIHHIYRDRVTDGCATFTIYKEGEETPFEQATYYLK